MKKEQLDNLQELFSKDELNAIALGFPIVEDFGYSFIDDEDELVFEENEYNFVDSDVESETEFDNFLTKKSRDRIRKRRELRKKGLSRKDARKQALKDIPRDKLKDALKKVSINNIKKDLRGLGRGVAKVTLVAPRGSYLALVRLNFRGYAYKLEATLKNPKLNSKLKKRWQKLGGNWDKLVKAINVGARKKAFVCGKKCQAKQLEYSNAVETAVVVGLLTLGGTIISNVSDIVNTAKISKAKQDEIDAENERAKRENETLTEIEKMRLEAEEKRLQSESDPRKLIINNPDLSPQEKKFALSEYDKALGKENTRKLVKYGVISGIALIGIIVAFKVIKRRKNK